jgi:hypothetical protein
VKYDCSTGTAYCKHRLFACVQVTSCYALHFPSYLSFWFSQTTASPFLKIYEPADCTVFLDAVAIEDTCGPSADDDDGYDDDVTDDDGYVPPFINPPPSVSATPFPSAAQAATAAPPSSISYCPQRAPTAMPVVAATAYPTSATAVPVSFRVMQVC